MKGYIRLSYVVLGEVM